MGGNKCELAIHPKFMHFLDRFKTNEKMDVESQLVSKVLQAESADEKIEIIEELLKSYSEN